MTATGRRRAAVTSADGQLLGLLCLKASQAGFCSDQDVRARALGETDHCCRRQHRHRLTWAISQPFALTSFWRWLLLFAFR